MLLDNLNLNYLRVFECVYRTRCMTTAAKELHLTQSGVSQHIKALEETLEAPLFDRIHRKIMPTKEAQKLYFQTRLALKHLEEVVGEISQVEVSLAGEIRIGMPIEFGNHKIIPAIAKLGNKYPKVNFVMQMDFASHLEAQLLSGDLDFAFVDEFVSNKNIETTLIAEEKIELCASPNYLKKFGISKPTKAYFEELDYIAYQEGEPVLRSWFSHHLRRKNIRLNVRARVMDVQAIARLISCGLGVGVLPGHILTNLSKEDGLELVPFAGSGKSLSNKISLAYLKGRREKSMVAVLSDELRCLI